MTSKGRWLYLLAALLLLWAGGCLRPRTAPPPPVRPDPALQLRLQLPPGPTQQLDPTPLTVRVRDQHNRPVTDATVSIDLTMPGMEMGKNQVVPKSQGDGIYVGVGRFTMAGEWQATVTASRAGHRTVQSFPIQVK